MTESQQKRMKTLQELQDELEQVRRDIRYYDGMSIGMTVGLLVGSIISVVTILALTIGGVVG